MRIDCKRWGPALRDWLEGWTANSARAAVETHLQACPACRAKLEAWRAVGRALRELPYLPAPKPRGALHLALALCVPTALQLVAFRAPMDTPPVDALRPSAVVQTLARPCTVLAQTLWNRPQEVI